MMHPFTRCIVLLAVAFAGALGFSERADAAYDSAAVAQVPTVAWLASHPYTGTNQASLSGFNGTNDGGQGTLVKESCVVDNGSCFEDSTHATFKRTNLNGDMRQWGLTRGSVYDIGANPSTATSATTIVNTAGPVLAAAGLYTLDTKQVNILFATTPNIPAGSNITCEAPSAGPFKDSFYHTKPGTIVLGHGAMLEFAGDQGGNTVPSCLVVHQMLYNTSVVSQWSGHAFSYPANSETDLEYLRGNMILAGDTAIYLNNVKGMDLHKLGVYGFDACLHRFRTDHLQNGDFRGDCNVGDYGDRGGDISNINDITIDTFLTRQVTNSSGDPVLNQADWSVTNITPSPVLNTFGRPQCRFTLGDGTVHYDPTLLNTSDLNSHNDPITFPFWYAQNFNGNTPIGRTCAPNGPGAITVISRTSNTAVLDINNSEYGTGAYKVTGTGRWTSGSNVICVVSTNVEALATKEIVADTTAGADGIRPGSSIVQVATASKGADPNDGCITQIVLDRPLSASTPANTDVAFTIDGGAWADPGQPCDGDTKGLCGFLSTQSRVFAGNSLAGLATALPPLSNGRQFATCFMSKESSGARYSKSFCFAHHYGELMMNANNCAFSQLRADDNGELDDADRIGVYMVGATKCSVDSNSIGKNGRDFVLDLFTTTDSVTTTNISSSVSAAGLDLLTVTSTIALGSTGNIKTFGICQTYSGSACTTTEEYVTAEIMSGTTVKLLARGQFMTLAAAYTSGAKLVLTAIGGKKNVIGLSNLDAPDEESAGTAFEIVHGGVWFSGVRFNGSANNPRTGFFGHNTFLGNPNGNAAVGVVFNYEDETAKSATSPNNICAADCPDTRYPFQPSGAAHAGVGWTALDAYGVGDVVMTTTNWPVIGGLGLIGSEYFYYNLSTDGIAVTKRGACGSTSVAHTDGDSANFIDYASCPVTGGTPAFTIKGDGTVTIPSLNANTFRTVANVAAIRSGQFNGAPALSTAGYYSTGDGGGNLYLSTGAACVNNITGDTASGQNTLKNLSSSAVYVGEAVSGAPNIPAGSKIASLSWASILTAGTWTNGSTTISNVPDVTGIAAGEIVSAKNLQNGTKVVSTTAPTTVINTTGSFHNGTQIVVASAAGIVPGMFVVVTAVNDAMPKTTPRSAIAAGLATVVSVVGTTVTITGSPDIAGVSANSSLRFTNGGSITISLPTTGAQSSETGVLIYQYNATMDHNATNTTSAASLSLNGDDGGEHLVDADGICWISQTANLNWLQWGAKPDKSSDSTGPFQNCITYNSQSTQPGPAGSCLAPAGVTGIYKASKLFMLKPVTFGGQGREQAIIQQMDGQPTDTSLMYTFALFDQNNRYPQYLSMEYNFRYVTFRGPDDVATTSCLWIDGYNTNPPVPDNENYHVRLENLSCDLFKGFVMYNSHESGAIIRMIGNNQFHGVTTDLNSNDCIHSDGGATWSAYTVVTSACDSGWYLNSPTSFALYHPVSFSNNHGATVTGTNSSSLNNAQINFIDFEYGFNKQNNFVIDSANIRIACFECRVNDSGQGSTAGTYSDIEITANASIPVGPVLTLTGNYFTKVHSEAAGQNHLNNITFDDGASASVAVDATTTTSSTSLQLWNNLATCIGCTSQIVGGYPVQGTLFSANSGLTAHAGGGQALATLLTSDLNSVATATNNDSVQLPVSFAGKCLTVSNTSALHPFQLYSNVATADTINNIAGATGVFQTPLTRVQYCSPIAGKWVAQLIGTSGNGVLCPLSEACSWTSTATWNRNAAAVPNAPTGTMLQVQDADGRSTAQDIIAYDNGGTAAPGLRMKVAQGTGASPTAVLSGDTLGFFGVSPYNGSSFTANSTGRLDFYARENFTGSHQATGAGLQCTPLLSTTRDYCIKVEMGGLFVPQTTAPVITGTCTASAVGNAADTSGEIACTGAGTAIVTFAYTKTNAPNCTVSTINGGGATALITAKTGSALTTTVSGAVTFDYTCFQKQ